MKKRIISMLLVLCMVLTMLPVSAYAVEAEETHVHNAHCDHVHGSDSMPESKPAEVDTGKLFADASMWALTTADANAAQTAGFKTPSEAAKFSRSEETAEIGERGEEIAAGTYATGYKIYINGVELTSAKTSVSGDSGTASYNASTNTLTLNNFTLNQISASNGIAIFCTNDITIELIGTNTITLSGVSGGGMAGVVGMGKMTIKKAASASGTPSLVIQSTQGSNNSGIGSGDQAQDGTYSLTIQDVDVKISDTSSSKGSMFAIDFAQELTMNNVKFTATDCEYGIFASRSTVTATLKNVTFDISYSTSMPYAGISFQKGTHQIENCSGSIKAYYPIESQGSLTLKNPNLTLTASGSDASTSGISEYGSGSLTISGGSLTVTSASGFGITADDTAKLELKDSAKVDITAEITGLYVRNNSAAVTNATLTVKTANTGINTFTSGASFTLNSGSVTVTGTGSTVTALSNTGSAYLKGGTFTTNSVYFALKNVGTKNVEISGGTQKLNCTYSGYASTGNNALTISGGADFTVTGSIYGLYSETSGSSITIKDASTKVTANAQSGIAASGSLSITGGTTNVTFTAMGIASAASTANISLTGGTVNLTHSGTEPSGKKPHGIYNEGKLTISGSANVTVTGAGTKVTVYGLTALGGSYTLTGGTVTLRECTIGLYVGTNLTLSGTNLNTSATDFYAIYPVNATLTLSSGDVTSTGDYVSFYINPGSAIDFAGSTVNATAQVVALYSKDASAGETAPTYKVSGGSLTLYGGQYAGNLLYSSLASDYSVYAGSSATDATEVSHPDVNTFANNKYVRISKKVKYTLTLVNVKGATSASLSAGEQFTYTAEDAPNEEHFKQWELTVNGTTNVIGTEDTITYNMPASDATLTAVYECCYGGAATCTELAHCTVCGKEYGILAMHDFTGKVEDEKYLCTAGDCVTKATYYYSCTMCGLSSKGTPYESTFEGKTGMHSYTGQNPTADYLCTAADCENAATYYYCCSGCGASSKDTEHEATYSYGDALGHDWGAWTGNGNGTHSRVCGNDSNHVETGSCSFESGVCNICGDMEFYQLIITSDETLVRGTDYTYTNGVLTILTRKAVTIKNADGVEVATDRIVVAPSMQANITLAGVNIDQSSTGGYDSKNNVHIPGYPAILIEDDSKAEVNIILAEGTENVLKGGYMVAALNKNGVNGLLNIKGDGSLLAQGAYGGAGIGGAGSFDDSVAYHFKGLVIFGGNITAIGGTGAAGIGSGYGGNASYIDTLGDNINIIAIGGAGAAGIGGGQRGGLYFFSIRGGMIIAIGGTGAAGIGGGADGGYAERIEIFYGDVTAIAGGGSSDGGAGIGGGVSSSADTTSGFARDITIYGGTVLAYGESSGIGSGLSTSGGEVGLASNITISGGTVTASGELTEELYQLLCDTVTANSKLTEKDFLQAIGGSKTRVGSGAGIGAAVGGKVENIVISGGSVNAIGGSAANSDNPAQDIGYGHGWTEEFTPANKNGEKIYPLTISNPDELDIYIDGVKWTPSNHKAIGNDTNLYLRLPGVKHTVKVGDTETVYHFDSTTKTFTPNACYDLDGDCLCDLCGETCHHIVTHEAKAATCTEVGWDAYETCSQCDYTTYKEIAALGHDPIHHDGQDATCTEKGWEAYDTCSRCDYTTYKEIAALGHDPIHHDGQDATCTEKGWEAYDTCSRCDYTTYKEIAALGHEYENGYCIHCGAKEPSCPSSDFVDLPDDWYHEAIDFMIANGLMNGMGKNKFEPGATTTRAMIVTVLYRLSGSPEVTGTSTFTDVPTGEWYSDAIAWAQDMGIVNGFPDGSFRPDEMLTREQLATMLWRCQGEPTVDDETVTVPATVSVYAREAMKWALHEGIFIGDNYGELNPTDFATRAQFAIIMMRYLGGAYTCPVHGGN